MCLSQRILHTVFVGQGGNGLPPCAGQLRLSMLKQHRNSLSSAVHACALRRDNHKRHKAQSEEKR